MPNPRFERGRGQRCPQYHAQSPVRVLIIRNVDVGNAIDVETVTLDVLDDTDDGRPRLGRVSSEPHAAPQRIAVWPILMSGTLIDDGHQRFAVSVVLGERAAA